MVGLIHRIIPGILSKQPVLDFIGHVGSQQLIRKI